MLLPYFFPQHLCFGSPFLRPCECNSRRVRKWISPGASATGTDCWYAPPPTNTFYTDSQIPIPANLILPSITFWSPADPILPRITFWSPANQIILQQIGKVKLKKQKSVGFGRTEVSIPSFWSFSRDLEDWHRNVKMKKLGSDLVVQKSRYHFC